MAVALWYHTIDLPDGPTPGWFDLRPVLHRMPFPDVRGKRCLDVGTYDGFLAFELERRGAAEVVATDIPDHARWDWPRRMRDRGPQALAAIAGPEKGEGFRTAAAALGSRVQRLEVSVYDLDPAVHGTFDVVVCGSLLLHLRDPVRALEALRAVCTGQLLSAEEVDLALSALRGRPSARLRADELCQWWIPNVAAHRRMVTAAGFDVVADDRRPYAIPFGAGHPPRGRDLRGRARAAAVRALCGSDGVPHHALLAR